MSKIIVANWKMNGTVGDCAAFSTELDRYEKKNKVIVCPPSPFLNIARNVFGSQVSLGAQDCHYRTNGSYTGDVSAKLLAEFGCKYVIVGHSERRNDHGETIDHIRLKIARVHEHEMTPIYCLGEPLEVYSRGKASNYLLEELEAVYSDAWELNPLIIAYEPIWAIGTNKIPLTSDIEEIHRKIRNYLLEKTQREIPVIYGGSVSNKNAQMLLSIPGVSGLLVGSFSLNFPEFAKVCAI